MKASELRAKNAAELATELESLLKAQFRKVRRDIARVRTLLTEKAGN